MGHYSGIVGHRLADDQAIDSYQSPDPNRPELHVEAEGVLRKHKDEYWIMGGTVATVSEAAWVLRGLERTLMDLALKPDFVERLLDIPFSCHLTAAKNLGGNERRYDSYGGMIWVLTIGCLFLRKRAVDSSNHKWLHSFRH